jgi:hypothetical protein
LCSWNITKSIGHFLSEKLSETVFLRDVEQAFEQHQCGHNYISPIVDMRTEWLAPIQNLAFKSGRAKPQRTCRRSGDGFNFAKCCILAAGPTRIKPRRTAIHSIVNESPVSFGNLVILLYVQNFSGLLITRYFVGRIYAEK